MVRSVASAKPRLDQRWLQLSDANRRNYQQRSLASVAVRRARAVLSRHVIRHGGLRERTLST